MLIATYLTLMMIFGGGSSFSFDPFKEALKRDIEDKSRRKELIAEIDRANDAYKSYKKDYKEISKILKETSARHDATRGDFRAIILSADERRARLMSELLDARFALHDKMSAEEWAAMHVPVSEE